MDTISVGSYLQLHQATLFKTGQYGSQLFKLFKDKKRFSSQYAHRKKTIVGTS